MPPKRGGGPGSQEVAGEQNAKLVCVGAAFSGKSSISLRVSKNEFSATQEPTIGAAFVSYRTTVSKSKTDAVPVSSPQLAANPGAGAPTTTAGAGNTATVKFEIWDTAGQERFKSLTPMYFRGAVGGLVVYDISNTDSFRATRTWIGELRKARETMAICLVGNKCDLPDDKRQVTRAEGEALAEEEHLGFFETSAKSGENVVETFDWLAQEIVLRGLAQPPRTPVGVVGPGTTGSGVVGNPKNASGGSGKKCDKC